METEVTTILAGGGVSLFGVLAAIKTWVITPLTNQINEAKSQAAEADKEAREAKQQLNDFKNQHHADVIVKIAHIETLLSEVIKRLDKLK